MMMSALDAGGMPLLTDTLRQADESNPKGYFEYAPVKKMGQGVTDWVDSARGKAVKVISALLSHLPKRYGYKVIFMEREINEILASQRHMLERSGKLDENPIPDAELAQSYHDHLAEVKSWLSQQDWIQTLYVSYNEVLRQPVIVFEQVADFLDGRVDPRKMASVVDPALYREHE